MEAKHFKIIRNTLEQNKKFLEGIIERVEKAIQEHTLGGVDLNHWKDELILTQETLLVVDQLEREGEWRPLEDNEYMASNAVTFKIEGLELTVRELDDRKSERAIKVVLPRQVRLFVKRDKENG